MWGSGYTGSQGYSDIKEKQRFYGEANCGEKRLRNKQGAGAKSHAGKEGLG